MADSADEPKWNIFGVKLKPSAIAENIAASLVIALAGFILLDLFTAFSNQLAGIMPKPGSATANMIDLTKITIAVIFAGAFAYYLNRLGLSAGNADELARLRARLTAGETAGVWYVRTVRRAIFVTDRFFGDAGKAMDSWKPHAFWLKKAAPLWTVASYDRCMQIATLYPLTCIFIVWVIWNDPGEAGYAIGFVESDKWSRVISALSATGIIFSRIMVDRSNNVLRFTYFSLFLMCSIVLSSAASAMITVLFIMLTIIIYIPGILSIFILVIIIILSYILNKFNGYEAEKFIFGVKQFESSVGIVIFLIVLAFYTTIDKKNEFYSIFNWKKFNYKILSKNIYFYISFLMIILFTFSPYILSNDEKWRETGTLIYFLPIISLLNAPFDWVALGVTRGLIRKGLEKGGIWPLMLGAVDIFISLVIIVFLGVILLFFTQQFNALASIGGDSKSIFNPLSTLRDLATPGLRNQPQYYWLYLMVLTTQIPAILNLGAGFLSVIRTSDFGNELLLRLMGQGKNLGFWARCALTAVQAGQLALAMTAGGLLFFLLFLGFVTVEPFAAGNLIDLLLWIAEANWPARLMGVAG